MPGLPRKEMPLLTLYKSANHQTRMAILANAIDSTRRLPAWFDDGDNETEAKTNSSMFETFQLLNYVSYTQRVETQQFFDISFDPSPLIAHFGTNNIYFECNAQGSKPRQMRLKKPIIEIPNDVWKAFRAAQQNSIEKVYQRLSSDLDVYNIFVPPKDAFPYKWYSNSSFNRFDEYEREQQALLALAKEVTESAQALTTVRIEAFKKAAQDLQKISTDNPKLGHLLLSVNNQAFSLSKLSNSEHLDTLGLAMTQTVAMLRGALPFEEYEALLNQVHGHATSSPEMQELCKTMLSLCTVAASVGIAALIAPALGIVAAGIATTAAASAAVASTTLFAAGATYAFFAGKDTEATGLSKAMADTLDARKESSEPIRTTSPDYSAF